jgi:hypothetical protein
MFSPGKGRPVKRASKQSKDRREYCMARHKYDKSSPGQPANDDQPATRRELLRRGVAFAGALSIGGLKAIGAPGVSAEPAPAAFKDLPSVDVVANAVRGKTAEDLLGKVKGGGTFASLTGAPANAAKYLSVRTIAFVSKQDTKNLEYTVEGVRAGKLTIPIGRKAPLRNAAEAHAAVAKGSAGKILLHP